MIGTIARATLDALAELVANIARRARDAQRSRPYRDEPPRNHFRAHLSDAGRDAPTRASTRTTRRQ